MAQIRNIQGRPVKLVRSITSPMGAADIPAGLTGQCVWDEGGEEVIVEFDRDVPNSGLLPNNRQAWVLRGNLAAGIGACIDATVLTRPTQNDVQTTPKAQTDFQK